MLFLNCYYSNLIEGRNTHPVDIEKTIKRDYSTDVNKRNLQLEASAHIAVQSWIDNGGMVGSPFSSDNIVEIHKKFGDNLPNELLWLSDPESGEKIQVRPGQLRHRDVKFGNHLPVSPVALPRFLEKFEQVFATPSKSEAIISVAAAHHRLLWIHPFF